MNERLSATEAQHLHDVAAAMRASIGQVIVGQHGMTELMLAALLSEGHVLLEGPPGVAKTLAVRTMARLVDCTFGRIQCTPDLMPADILGTNIFNPKTLEFEYRRGPVFANLLLTDEINRSPAKTQSALFEVMEERQTTSDGISHPMPQPFMVLATMNPIEQEGTYRLPEAQLDRFIVKILIDYPTLAEETEIIRRHHEQGAPAERSGLKPLLSHDDVVRYAQLVRSATVEPGIFAYIAELVHRTRAHHALYLGASPRASLSALAMARSMAVLQGRDFVVPDDVKSVIAPVMRHRVQLLPERELEGVTVDSVLADIVASVDVPR
jgi:MoxR-like ATPase